MSFTEAMIALAPNAVWTAHDDAITEWHSPDIEQPTAEAIAAKRAEIEAQRPLKLLRIERNRLLAETDWWASSDLTMTDAQTAYRQALRDITDSYTSLDDVVWPTKPQVLTNGTLKHDVLEHYPDTGYCTSVLDVQVTNG